MDPRVALYDSLSNPDKNDVLTVERVVDEWAEDSKIDPSELGLEQIKIEQVHDKYLKLLSRARRELRHWEKVLKLLRRDKFEFYTMGPTDVTRLLGWRLPPQGRLLKNEAERWVDSDPQVVDVAIRCAEAKDVVDAVTEKLKMIAFRGNRLKSAIEWHLFTHGK